MKYLKIITITFLVLSIGFVACKKEDTIDNTPAVESENYFINDYAAAKASAETQGRKIFVDYYASWCTICSGFKSGTLQNQQVIDYINANYVVVELDAEDEGKEMYDALGFNSYPVLAIYNTDGSLVANFQGTKNPDALIEWLEANK